MLIVTAVPRKTKYVVTGKRKKKKRKYISRVLDRRISYTRIPDSYIILWPDTQRCHFHLIYYYLFNFETHITLNVDAA